MKYFVNVTTNLYPFKDVKMIIPYKSRPNIGNNIGDVILCIFLGGCLMSTCWWYHLHHFKLS